MRTRRILVGRNTRVSASYPLAAETVITGKQVGSSLMLGLLRLGFDFKIPSDREQRTVATNINVPPTTESR